MLHKILSIRHIIGVFQISKTNNIKLDLDPIIENLEYLYVLNVTKNKKMNDLELSFNITNIVKFLSIFKKFKSTYNVFFFCFIQHYIITRKFQLQKNYIIETLKSQIFIAAINRGRKNWSNLQINNETIK